MSRKSSIEAMHEALMAKMDSAEVFIVAPDVYGLLWPTEVDGVSYSGTRVYMDNVLVIPGNLRMRIGSIELHCRSDGYDAMSEIYMVQM